jgi:RNA polymerase sigma factor (sigma-70 family)
MSEHPDEETLRWLRRRDPRGFDQAYATYGARLLGFLTRLAGPGQSHLAEDLLQQTFLKLAEHGPELRAGSDLRAWLYTVARHAFLGHVRGRRREVEAPGLELVCEIEPEVEARLLLGDVEAALARLRLEDRELLLLIGVEGLSPQSIAQMLELEPATLRKRLNRARARLLTELGRATARAPKENAS